MKKLHDRGVVPSSACTPLCDYSTRLVAPGSRLMPSHMKSGRCTNRFAILARLDNHQHYYIYITTE